MKKKTLTNRYIKFLDGIVSKYRNQTFTQISPVTNSGRDICLVGRHGLSLEFRDVKNYSPSFLGIEKFLTSLELAQSSTKCTKQNLRAPAPIPSPQTYTSTFDSGYIV